MKSWEKSYSEFNQGNNSLPKKLLPFLYAGDSANAFLIVYCYLEKDPKIWDHHARVSPQRFSYRRKRRTSPLSTSYCLILSDYKDAQVWSEAAEVGFFGVIGSVSFKDEPTFVSQVSFLKQYAQTSRCRFRFHCFIITQRIIWTRITFAKPGHQFLLDVTNFTWATIETAFAASTFSKSFNQSIEPLVISTGKNYWLSAHTHVTAILPPERFIVGGLIGEKYFTGLNIGSTTDYRAHVAIVERYEYNKNDRMDDFVGYREIPIFEGDRTLLTSIPEAIGEYGRKHAEDSNFQQIIPSLDEWRKAKRVGVVMDIGVPLIEGLFKGNKMSEEDSYWIDVGATILGLNRKYIEDAWQDQQTNASVVDLSAFVAQFISRTGSNREEVLSFLGLLAGAYENKLLPGKCDLDPQCLKELCRVPK